MTKKTVLIGKKRRDIQEVISLDPAFVARPNFNSNRESMGYMSDRKNITRLVMFYNGQ